MTLLHQAAQKAVEQVPRYSWDQDMDVLAGPYPDGEWVRHADVVAALQQQPEPVAQPLADAEADAIHSMPWVRDCLLRYVDRPCDKEARDAVRAIVNAASGLMVGAMPALQHQEVPPVHIDVERMNRALRGPRILIPEGLSVEEVVAFINGHADCMAEQDQHQEEPREPVAEALSPRERELLTEVKVRLGEINLCQEWRDHAFAVLGRLAASPSTTRQQEATAPLRHATKENGDCPHWCQACAAERTSRQQEVGSGLGCEVIDDCKNGTRTACMVRGCALAAAPSTPEKAGGVPDTSGGER